MKKRIHKLFSLMLTLILVVGMIPMTSLPAFAATTDVPFTSDSKAVPGSSMTVDLEALAEQDEAFMEAYFNNSDIIVTWYLNGTKVTTNISGSFGETIYLTGADGGKSLYVTIAADGNTYTSKTFTVETPPDVYVGGVRMYDGYYLAVGATATQTTKPSGGYAYYEDGTLTLNNYSYEGKGYENSASYYYAVIYTKNDLTLELIGNNTLTQTAYESDMIYVDGANLTVGGDGKLTGTAEYYGLYADKDITINGGTIEVSTYYGSISSDGDVIINGGDITAESERKAGIYSSYDVTINGGNVTATGGDRAIDYGSSGSFTVAKNPKIQASTTVDGELGEYVAANLDTYKKIVIHAHKLTAVAAKAATCKAAGNKAYYTCECGKWFEDSAATKEITDKNSVVVPKLTTHTYDGGTITTQPTCKAEGVKTYKCTVCGTTKTESVPVVDHSYVSGNCKYCGEAAPVTITAPVIKSSSVADTGKIKLTWAAVEGAAKYKVYRATSKTGKYSKMYTTSKTSYTNTNAKPGKYYYYYVVAVDANGVVSEKSNIVGRTCDYARPAVTASNVASTGKIKLTWTAVEGATSYKVYRSTKENGTYSLMKTVKDGATTYTNTSAVAGKKYYYKVRAYGANSSATSAYSVVDARTCDLPRPTVSITTSSGKPKVSWAAITGAKEYKIYRSTSKTGTYKVVKTTTAKYWKDTTAKKGKTYYYKVVAVHKNSSANSAYSTVVSKKCTK